MSAPNKIVCLAVDDEPPALAVLEQYINSVPALELAGSCRNCVDAMEFLRHRPIDLLFMDIQMPQLLGTNFVRTLKNPPIVIFTTAYRKFAVEGFELNAVDYLLKPISFERFIKAVNRALDLAVELPTYNSPSQSPDRCLYLRSSGKIVRVPVDEILYIESLKDYVTVVTGSRRVVARQSMASLEESLAGGDFMRIHRSFIISVHRVDSYSRGQIEIGGKTLQISRTYKHNVEKILDNSWRPRV